MSAGAAFMWFVFVVAAAFAVQMLVVHLLRRRDRASALRAQLQRVRELAGELATHRGGCDADVAADIYRALDGGPSDPNHTHGAWCHPSADGCPDDVR